MLTLKNHKTQDALHQNYQLILTALKGGDVRGFKYHVRVSADTVCLNIHRASGRVQIVPANRKPVTLHQDSQISLALWRGYKDTPYIHHIKTL